jgi:hypothetical protein
LRLATPLPDWTSSPFAAAFFAYAEPKSPESGFRVVFGMNENAVTDKSQEISQTWFVEKEQLEQQGRKDEAEKLGQPQEPDANRDASGLPLHNQTG